MISQSRLFFSSIFIILFFIVFPIGQPVYAKAAAALHAPNNNKTESVHVFGSVLWNRGLAGCVTERDKTFLAARFAIDVSVLSLC